MIAEDETFEVVPAGMNDVIYVLIDPRTNQARYVGKTKLCRVRIRLTSHIRDKIPSRKRNWIKSLITQAIEPIIEVIEILPEGAGDSAWKEAESFWIAYLRFAGSDLTNLTHGGEGLCGHSFTPEHRRKIGDAHIGRIVSKETLVKLSAAAKKQSHDHLRAYSASQKGKRLSPEHCAKLSVVQSGRKHSEETKSKMSASAMGRKASVETRARISEAQKHRSPEWQEKISAKLRGRKLSPETLLRYSIVKIGTKHSAETRAKMSLVQKLRHAEIRAKKPVL